MSAATAEPSTRRAAGVVGLAVIASRLFGLVREQVFAAMFGAGKLLDIYLAAFQIPNLLRDLFAEGALSIAFTTMFTTAWDTEGEKPAWELANLILTAMIALMGALCIVAIAAAPLLVEVTNFGFHTVPGKFEMAVRLTRILFPFILFVSLAAAVMGMLNARFVFGIPASASTVFNIVSVIAGVSLALAFDPAARATWPHPRFTQNALYGVSLGVLLGGVAQLVIQLPVLFRLGFRFRWRLNLADPRLARLWALMWPSVVAASAVQVNVLVNGNFASTINGGRSWLFCAFRLAQLPIGLFGVSLATATLPAVTRAFARKDMAAFGATMRDSLRLSWFLALPAAAGLGFLARPIIALVYQHGRFSAHDTLETAYALQAYAIGLAAYAAIRVLTPCFYALGLPKTPLRISLIAIAVNLALNTANATVFGLGHVGLALATSMVALLNFGQLAQALSRQVNLGALGDWLSFLVRCLIAAAACGGAAYGINGLIEGHTANWALRGLGLALAIGASVPVYFAAARGLRLQESADAWRMIRRRIPFLR
ncbi:MAG TPA: murein biosynthesis integral membrane protein MurJ [Caulobacteraceae bacterium]|jgi:putative peptidoglycan lipid II flippase|nr:murein biosynthesis integral membrane protein MurJ [Caulobacteraceae bacterium]